MNTKDMGNKILSHTRSSSSRRFWKSLELVCFQIYQMIGKIEKLKGTFFVGFAQTVWPNWFWKWKIAHLISHKRLNIEISGNHHSYHLYLPKLKTAVCRHNVNLGVCNPYPIHTCTITCQLKAQLWRLTKLWKLWWDRFFLAE